MSNRAAGGGAGNRAGSAGAGASNRAAGGGADRIGSRDLSRSGGGNRDAFGGGTRGYNGSSARSQQQSRFLKHGIGRRWRLSRRRWAPQVSTSENGNHRSTEMRAIHPKNKYSPTCVTRGRNCLGVPVRTCNSLAAQQSTAKEASPAGPAHARPPRPLTLRSRLPMRWSMLQSKFDTAALTKYLALTAKDVVFTGEFAQDRKHASDFRRRGP